MTDLMTHDAGELVRRVRAREVGAAVVVAIYRLVKVALLHEPTNQALMRQVEQAHEAIKEYATRAGVHVSLLFSRRAVFVSGDLLKGSRSVYESALELGGILDWCGGAELAIARDASAEDLHLFAEAVARAKASERGSYTCASTRIRLRPVNEAVHVRGLELEDLDVEARILRTYATAVVALRRFYEDLYAGHLSMPPQIKRVAQSIVDLSEWKTLAFLGVSEVRNANNDEAGRAVNTAILAVAMARQITDDRVGLSQLALAALVHDVARPRAAGLLGAGGPLSATRAQLRLTDEHEDRLPAGAAAVLTALGRVNEPTIVRTVIAFEALWLGRLATVGPVYRGTRGPTLHARIVAIARRYNELMTPEPGVEARTPDAALRFLAGELAEASDFTVLRTLASALRVYPEGTVVLLSSGEAAEVVRAGVRRFPTVRPVLDAEGGVIEGAEEIDLAAPEIDLRIVKVVGVEGWKKGQSGAPPPRGQRSSFPAPTTLSSRPAPRMSSRPAPRVSSRPPPSEGRRAQADAAPYDGRTLAIDDRTVLRASPTEEAFSRSEAAETPPSLAPSARGTLASTPLVHVLVYMFDHAVTGSVELSEPDGIRHRIYFRRGAPVKVRVGRLVSPLGELLVADGLVDADGAAAAVEESKRLGLRLGEFFVSEGVLTRAELGRALEAQIVAKISGLANLPRETSYALFRDVDLLEDTGPEGFVPCDGLDVVLATVRLWHDRERVARALGRLAKIPLVLDEGAFVSGLSLGAAERAAMSALFTGRPYVADLLAESEDAEAVASLLYALAVTRQLTLPGQKSGPMGAARFTGSRGATLAPRVRPSSSHPPDRGSIPDLPSGASLPPLAVASIAPPASLAPPASIAPPVSIAPPASAPPPSIAPPAPSPSRAPPTIASPPLPEQLEEAERALEAMASVRSAEQAFDRGDIAGALRHARRAESLAPVEMDPSILLAWFDAASGAPEAVARSLARLDELLEIDPTSERALLYRGKLLLRAGKPRQALRDFDALLAINPSHKEAASEARLARKRSAKK